MLTENQIQKKYFTPGIEDIRVGYECEVAYLHEDNWTPVKYRHREETLAGIQAVLNYNRRIRVPYLTKEQIEAEGWKLSWDFSHLGEKHGIDFQKGDVWKDAGQGAFLTYNPHINTVKITTTDEGFNMDGPNNSIKFFGECKDINTFRYICKLLGI